MKIRWRFFLILLAFSVIPLLVVTLIDGEISRKLLSIIRSRSNQVISGIVSRELRQSAESSAMLLSTQRKTIELTLHILEREVTRVLNERPQSSMIGTPIYLASDFDQPGSCPPDAFFSDFYRRKRADRPSSPILISRKQPAFLLDNDRDKVNSWPTLSRLRGLTPLFSDLYQYLTPQVVFRLSATLESGVAIYFPGHGGVPENFQPDQTPWYRKARENPDDVYWEAISDPVTGYALFTASKAVLDTSGRFVGAVAVDILLENVIKENELSTQWSDRMLSFLLFKHPNPVSQEDGLMVLAEKNYKDQAPTWAGVFKNRWIDADLSGKFIKNLRPQSAAGSGVVQLPYDGVDSIWAYAFMEEKNLIFLIIVPQDIVNALPNEVDQTLKHLWRSYGVVVIVIILVVLLVVTLMAFWGASVITNMFPRVVDAWRRLGQGDFSVRLDLHFNDERDIVIHNFNEMVPRLEENIRLHQALNLAHEVQQNLIPNKPPQMDGFDIAGIVRYCDETGGDYYDFLEKRDHNGVRFVVLLGDVSGHGIASALLMATARGLIRQRVSMPGRPAEIIADVNRQLSKDTQETGQFMTFFYSEFDRHRSSVTWVTAGHNPALVYDPRSDSFTELGGKSLAMGVLEEFDYHEYQQKLDPGQTVVIGTDGIWEARNDSGQMFGLNRLKMAIRSQGHGSADAIRAAIAEALDQFMGESGFQDDVTMVVVKVLER